MRIEGAPAPVRRTETLRHVDGNRSRRRWWSTGGWLAVGTTLLCLLTAGGGMTTTDAVVAFDVTRNLVERGSLATTGDLIGNPAYQGRGGQYFSPFGIAQSVWNIPFYVGGRLAAAWIGPPLGATDTLPKAAVALATVPAVGLLAWVCFELLITLGAVPRRAVATVLLLIVSTPLWPYSGFGFNQPLTAFFLWLAVLAAMAALKGRPNALVASGVAAGLALLTRHEMLGAAVLIGGFIAVRSADLLTAIGRYSLGLLPLAGLWAGVNWWRFGNPLDPGYLRDPVPGFGGPIIDGAHGLLFSPYASLFLYCPIALLSFAGLRALARRHQPATVLFVTLFLAYFLLYASLDNWMGGRSYGPRYLVPLLPALVLPLAFWSPARRMRPAVAAVALLSVAVQLPGVLIDYSKVRMQRAATGETVAQDRRWSGTPLLLNARAAVTGAGQAIRHLTNLEQAPRVDASDPSLSMRLTFSLDLWWLHLVYLGIIDRMTAIMIAAALAVASVLSYARAVILADEKGGG